MSKLKKEVLFEERISIIPDHVNLIAKEVADYAAQFDLVLTSGGVGPTHDDLTYAGIALALCEELVVNRELDQLIGSNSQSNDGGSESPDKQSLVPASSELVYGIDPATGRHCPYPVVKVKNIYILPGIPDLFVKGFEIVKDSFRDQAVKFYSRNFYLDADEDRLAKSLSKFALKYSHRVNVGSYPVVTNNHYKVRVMLDSSNELALKEACEDAETMFAQVNVAYEPDPVGRADELVYALAQSTSPLGQLVAHALETIEKAFDLYAPNRIVICFNGGKDCTALLHLIYAAFKCRRSCAASPTTFPYRLLFVRSQISFPELEQFVQSTLNFYPFPGSSRLRSSLHNSSSSNGLKEQRECSDSNSTIILYEGPIKSSLEKLKQDYPDVEAVFIGTRRSDPKAAGSGYFQQTDPGWPNLMRISPLLDWTYASVWQFLRSLSLPYCPLYDVGYTSIGSPQDTHPNPKLRYITEAGRVAYRPAYSLTDEAFERSGRFN